VKSATDTVDLAVTELGDGRCVLKELVVIEGGGYPVREAKDISVPFDKVGLGVAVSSHREQCRWGQVDANLIVRSSQKLLCLQSLLCHWSCAVVEWVCINWKDIAMKAI
jgi:hypothetical protein